MTTADQLTSQTCVTFIGADFTETEARVTGDVMMRVTSRIHELDDVKIYCTPRGVTGWLEWSMRLTYKRGGAITVGIVSRIFGGETEFHS